MKFLINPKIFDNYPGTRIAVTVVKGIDNNHDIPVLNELHIEAGEALRSKISSEKLSTDPKIASWREAYRMFGAKARDYPSSIESLCKRVIKGNEVIGINTLVDIYNYISIKHMLPLGGEDLDKMDGDLQLTYAEDEIPVQVLGKDSEEAPNDGEVIYKDNAGTICRRWNWREVERTMLTKDTKNCILVIEALEVVSDAELIEAQEELSQLVTKYCGGEATNYIFDTNNSIANIY